MSFDENVAYWKSKEVSMDSNDGKEREAPKEKVIGPYNIAEHPINHQEEPKGPSKLVDPIVVPKIRKRPTWLRSTL